MGRKEDRIAEKGKKELYIKRKLYWEKIIILYYTIILFNIHFLILNQN
jgi:hypothetical protein